MSRKRKRSHGWLWSAGLLFSAGYFTPLIARHTGYEAKAPVIGAAVAVALTIPFAAVTRGALRGALVGLALGLAAAMGICFAMVKADKPLSPEVFSIDVALTALPTMICCTAVGALFALLAERRRRLLYGDDG